MSTFQTTSILLLTGAVAAVVTSVACGNGGTATSYDRIGRHEFNRAAVRLDLPLFWVADENNNGAVEPEEVASLLFYSIDGHWVEDGSFTPAFELAYARIEEEAGRDDVVTEGLDENELQRRRLVRDDLDYGIATLVHNDLHDLPDDHRSFVQHMLTVARLIDELYAVQSGASALADQVPADDLVSQAMFRRNWGPGGRAPSTERNPDCSAIPGAPKPKVDAYPASLQDQDDFCAWMAEHDRADELLDPFTVVREVGGELTPVALNVAYREQMTTVAEALRAAATALTDAGEDPLRAYLEAAAQAFTDNQWQPADEAWTRMNANSSRWYLRVGPDEVYWDPCGQKAGFHLTLALINRDSLAWQERLTPVRQEMESRLAELIGSPYRQREVAFHLPDFIDIVINAGNDRIPFGATLGQSLPNWGPVANEGRGRTVAMSNLYTDADSLAIRRAMAESLFDQATMQAYTDSQQPGLLATILHEAAHNLGPSHEYRVNGKTDTEVFGGSLASTLEELKAQSGALWYLVMLQEHGIISEELMRETWVDSLIWAAGHISRGMYTATGGRKAYSQTSVVQVGVLLEEGAVRFDPQVVAANGSDQGAFTVDFDKMPAAVEALMAKIGAIKATGDRDQAEALCATMVDGDAVPQELIAERILRHPKASFVYSLDL
jgi:hypothetical protein